MLRFFPNPSQVERSQDQTVPSPWLHNAFFGLNRREIPIFTCFFLDCRRGNRPVREDEPTTANRISQPPTPQSAASSAPSTPSIPVKTPSPQYPAACDCPKPVIYLPDDTVPPTSARALIVRSKRQAAELGGDGGASWASQTAWQAPLWELPPPQSTWLVRLSSPSGPRSLPSKDHPHG